MGTWRAAAAAVTASAPPPIGELRTEFVPRAVALDIDGTLVDARLELHPRTRAAVRAAAALVPVILATGRMYRSTLRWATELGISEPLVCYQGALIRQPPPPAGDGTVIFEEGLDAAIATRAVRISHEHGWHVQAYVDDELYCDEDRPEGRLYAAVAQVPIRFVDDLAALVQKRGSTKIVVVSGDPAVTDAAIAAFTVAFGSSARVTRSLEQFIEVVSPRVSKAISLDTVCARHGLSLGDAVAVGDAGNDAEMLAGAGLGVVVRGARPEVLAQADATCAPPDEAGVADVLERLLLSR